MDYAPYIMPGIAVVSAALTQAVKPVVPNQARRWLPLCAAAVGLACSVATNLGGIGPGNAVEVIASGLVSGLAGCGVFELAKQAGRGADDGR